MVTIGYNMGPFANPEEQVCTVQADSAHNAQYAAQDQLMKRSAFRAVITSTLVESVGDGVILTHIQTGGDA